MKIKLITVGKLKEKYLKDGIAEYIKRLGRFAKVEQVELVDEKTPDRASQLENQQILEKEGQRILSKISDKEYVIVLLAIEGKQFPSEKFSQTIDQIMISGYSNLTFVIGGSLGLSPEVKKKRKSINELWSINSSSSVDEISVGGTNLSCFHDSTGESLP